MTGPYYWRTLFTFDRNVEDEFLLDNPEYFWGEPSTVDTVYVNGFDSGSGRWCAQLEPVSDRTSFCMADSVQATPEYVAKGPFAEGQWVRVSADFLNHREGRRGNMHNSAQLVLRFYRSGASIKERIVRIHRVLNEDPQQMIGIEAEVPNSGADEVRVLVWNGGAAQPPLLMDNLTVVTLE